MGFLRKLFGGAPKKPGIKAKPLTAAELRLLESHRANFTDFQRRASLSGDPVRDAPWLGDELLAWWRSQPKSTRVDANDLTWAIGTLIGDHVASQTNMNWMLVTAPIGTSIGLYAEASGKYRKIILAPIDSVAKRFAESVPDDLQQYAAFSIAQVKRMRSS